MYSIVGLCKHAFTYESVLCSSAQLSFMFTFLFGSGGWVESRPKTTRTKLSGEHEVEEDETDQIKRRRQKQTNNTAKRSGG